MEAPVTSPGIPPCVAGIILAAGESSRMGTDKALLALGGETFLNRLLKVFSAEVDPVLVVLGHHADEIAATVDAQLPVSVLLNPDYKLGQLSSLKAALRYLSEQQAVDAALLCLVDHPGVSKSIVRGLIERFRQTAAPVVVPSCRNRRGHPVLFARKLFPELLEAPLEHGAISVLRKYEKEFEYVVTEDEGVLLDVDLPADYEALKKRWETTAKTNSAGEPS